jgi:hypothetical protein
LSAAVRLTIDDIYKGESKYFPDRHDKLIPARNKADLPVDNTQMITKELRKTPFTSALQTNIIYREERSLAPRVHDSRRC